MRYKKTLYIFLISLILLNLTIIHATNNNNKNTSNYFRIHVVANSDSIDDQILKYNISKVVNEYVTSITENSSSKKQSKEIIESNIQNILNLCNNELKKQNSNYTLTAHIGKMYYETKIKNNITMDSGVYDSLKIIIGNGQGQNWWSLIYPTTFCENLNNKNLENNEINENTEVTYSFKLLEIFQNIFEKTN